MIKTDVLKGEIVKNKMTQKDVAKLIGITPKTFYDKMNKGIFGSNEIEIMIEALHITDPINIFFAKE